MENGYQHERMEYRRFKIYFTTFYILHLFPKLVCVLSVFTCNHFKRPQSTDFVTIEQLISPSRGKETHNRGGGGGGGGF